MSVAATTPIRPDAASASSAPPWPCLLGVHGLALMVVFPLGTQEVRLWHPGVGGVGVLAAAFPLATVIGGLWARRRAQLPARFQTLSWLAFLSTLPCALSYNYEFFFFARMLAGLMTGVSYVAIHRAALPGPSTPAVSPITPRIIAFGMPVCIAAAVTFDWRATFVPILAAFAALAFTAPRRSATMPASAPILADAAPAGLVATGALAFVSASYLTVMSGFLVYNAGHTEFHIPLALGTAAVLGLGVPPLIAWLRARVSGFVAFAVTLGGSAASLFGLLALRSPQPAVIAVTLIAVFLAIGSARHLALAGIVLPSLSTETRPPNQAHTHLAHHLGSGLGALASGTFISLTPAKTAAGMPVILGCSLVATGIALTAGFLAAPKTEYVQTTADVPDFVSENEKSPV